MGGKRIEVGERFGDLMALHLEHVMSTNGRVRSHWFCACDCGGSILVDSGNLRTGNTTRCAACTTKAKGLSKTTHGHTRGRKPTRAYTTWQSMWSRCTDPNNKRYADWGGRGITVHPKWRSFEAFLADMGEPAEDKQLDRKDNDAGYSPDNCVWATRKEQGRNKRNNIVLTYQGRTQTMITWCEELGLVYDTVKARVRKGWPPERALAGGDLRQRNA